MRTTVLRALLCLLMFNSFFTTALIGQVNEVGLVNRSYTKIKNVRYSISSEVSIESISPYDLVAARGYDNTLQFFQSVLADGDLFTSTEYESAAYNADSWLPQIYRSEMSKEGAKFYGKENELLYQSSEEMRAALEREYLNVDSLDHFGLFGVIPEFDAEGFDWGDNVVQVLEDGRYTIFEDNSETTFDPVHQTVITRIFEDGTLILQDERYFRPTQNGYTIPTYEVLRSYSPMINGGWIEKCETNTIQDYKINGELVEVLESSPQALLGRPDQKNGVTQFEAEQLETQDVFSFYPNPTSDKLHIKGSVAIYSLRLINGQGATVLEVAQPQDREVQLDLSSYPVGPYFLHICSEKGQTMKQIIKN